MTRTLTLAVVWSLVIVGAAAAASPILSVGPFGSPDVVDSGRDACWSEPADLNGLIGSSEVIGEFGLESELANDFVLTTDATITLARWWGGYYNNNGCGDVHGAPTWNLEFFDDGDCVPLNLLAEYVIPDYAGETFIHCQAGLYPVFEYEGSVSFPVTANTRYWLVAQAGDHAFPPQVGRVEAGVIRGCAGGFRSIFFSYPDWVFTDEVFEPHDWSQEFECGTTPVQRTTWGTVKALFR